METVALSAYEAERGKPMPGRNHAKVQHRLSVALSRYDETYSILPELTLRVGDQTMVPDLSILPFIEDDWSQDEVKVSDLPLFVIEIISPSQALADLLIKSEQYLTAGVPSCWIVLPALQTIAVLSPNQKPRYYTEGVVQDQGTGIEVPVEAIFG